MIKELIEELTKANSEKLRTQREKLNAKIMTILFGKPILSGNYPNTLFWWNNGFGYSIPLDFLTSLDTTIKFIPKEFGWQCGNINGHVGGTPFGQIGQSNLEYVGYGETASVSIVIALLKMKLGESDIEDDGSKE